MKNVRKTVLILMLALLLLTQSALGETASKINISHAVQNGSSLTVFETAATVRNEVGDQTYVAQNYKLIMNGLEFDAVNAQKYSGSIHYIVCVDVSSSVGGKNDPEKIERDSVRGALNNFVGDLRSNEAMTIIPFGDSYRAVIEATNDAGSLTSVINGIEFKDDKTNLYAAIYEAIRVAGQYEYNYPNQVIIVLTDGKDEPSEGVTAYTAQDVEQKVIDSNFPIYIQTFPRSEMNYSEHETIAQITGGIYQQAAARDFSQSMANTRSIVRNTSEVTFELFNDGKREPRRANENLIATMYNGTRDLNSYNYIYSVDWSVVPTPTPEPTPEPTPVPTATPDKEVEISAIDDLTEDSTVITVRTEPNARITVSTDSGQTVLDGAGAANDSGVYTWDAAANGYMFKKDSVVDIQVTDSSDNVRTESKKVGQSSRAQIEVNILDQSNEGVISQNLRINGRAEKDSDVTVTWTNINTGSSRDFPAHANTDGAFNLSIPYAEADAAFTPENHAVEGLLDIKYSDGYGVSRAYRTFSFVWDIKTDRALGETTFDVVSEDTSEITLTTEPGATVVVTRGGQEVGRGTAQDNGRVSIPLSDYLKIDDQKPLQFVITDEAGNEGRFTQTVAASNRRAITVQVKDMVGTTFTGNELVVTGTAEAGQDVVVEWLDSTSAVLAQKTATCSPIGNYEASLGAWSEDFTRGGNISVHYRDRKAASKTGLYDAGSVVWLTPSPEPTQRATPVPTAVPTEAPDEPTETPVPIITIPPQEETTQTEPEPSDTPEPEPEGFVNQMSSKFHEVFGETTQDMLRNWKFWVLVAILLLIIVLIVVLIIVGARKKNKEKNISIIDGEVMDNPDRETQKGVGTVRRKGGEGMVSGKPTERSGNMPGGVIPSGGTARLDSATPFTSQNTAVGAGKGGTTRIDAADAMAQNPQAPVVPQGGTARIDAGEAPSVTPQVPAAPVAEAPRSGGTVRMTAPKPQDVTGGGTVRIRPEKPKGVELRVEEHRDWAGYHENRTVRVVDKIMLGRIDAVDFIVKDETVSSRHAVIEYEGGKFFITDNNSANGTRLNGTALEPNARTELPSGSTVEVGRTILVLSYDQK